MIISVERIKSLVNLDGWTNEKIQLKLDAIEQTIRAYTNNNFQNRGFRVQADIMANVFLSESLIPFDVGDTVQVSESQKNNGLFTIAEVNDENFIVNEDVRDEDNVLVTKVEYPADVVACAVNLMEWEVNMRGKVGIQSETLSRHSVTYVNMDGSGTSGASNVMGYPASLLGCLKAYRKARC